MINAMNFVKNPYAMCEKIYNLVQTLTGQLKELVAQKVYDPRGRVISFFVAIPYYASKRCRLPRRDKIRNYCNCDSSHLQDFKQKPRKYY